METVNLIVSWMSYICILGCPFLVVQRYRLEEDNGEGRGNSWRGTAVTWARIDEDVKSAAFGDKLHCRLEEDVGFKDNS